jgi:SAM-dependent methyltransferase
MASGRFRQVLAVEPTPSLAAACRERGVTVIEKPIENVDLGQHSADVVAAFEVVEHLLDPGAFVRACAQSVRSKGLIVLTCPNGRGFEVEVLGMVADTVDTEHLNYFNPKSLALLLEKNGFDVLETSTPGVLDADIVRNKVLAGKFDLSNQRFLQIVLLERWEELGQPFQEFLQKSGLSSHMWIVGRKRA